MNDTSRVAWLVRLELVAVALGNLALLALAALSWIAFAWTAVDSGMFTEAPGSPFEPNHIPTPLDPIVERGFQPIGYLLMAGPFVVVAGGLAFFAILLHRWIVVPLAATLESHERVEGIEDRVGDHAAATLGQPGDLELGRRESASGSTDLDPEGAGSLAETARDGEHAPTAHDSSRA